MVNNTIFQFLKLGSLVIFFSFIVVFIILSVVLNYHWKRYGISAGKIGGVRLWYFSVSFALLFIMALSLIIIFL